MAQPEEDVAGEIAEEAADVDGVDLSLPAYIEIELASASRQRLRNTAVLTQMNQRIARKIQNTPDATRVGKELSGLIRQIAELDKLYPKAKKRMGEMDEQGRPQEEE